MGEEEYGEKKDFGSEATGVSSSLSAGVIIGGAGCIG